MTSCTREASGLERAEERGPEGAILGVARREAEDLAAASPHTPVATTPPGRSRGGWPGPCSRWRPGTHRGSSARQGAVPEGSHLAIEVGADAADLDLGDAAVKPALVTTWIARVTWRLQELERHPGKGAAGSPCVTSVLVPASAKLDDLSVERLQPCTRWPSGAVTAGPSSAPSPSRRCRPAAAVRPVLAPRVVRRTTRNPSSDPPIAWAMAHLPPCAVSRWRSVFASVIETAFEAHAGTGILRTRSRPNWSISRCRSGCSSGFQPSSSSRSLSHRAATRRS
jgi:hypothetical protein